MRRLAEQQRMTFRGPLETEDDPDERRLAAAVWTSERDELALSEF